MCVFFESIEKQLDQKLPFVIYNKPNSTKIIAFLQFNNHLILDSKLDKNGFVFAPFDSEDYIFFSEDNCEIIKKDGIDFNEKLNEYIDVLPSEDIQEFHEKLVLKGVNTIKENQFLKVVLSRKETISAEQKNFILYFKKLIETYKTAFCYCFYHPEIGMWLGATPEQLLKVDKDLISTVSLAGTKLYIDNKQVEWDDKEKEEQLFVTQFIEESLEPYSNSIEKTEPYTAKAGNLLHIKTDIKAVKKNNVLLSEIVTALHPTPALCGLPKLETKKFIIENEGYERKFYSGFLGEINKDYETNETDKSDIFVNLRCMELKENSADLFIGGGITKESNPSSEFLETINKSQTIKKILK